jgi:hypothetical protein
MWKIKGRRKKNENERNVRDIRGEMGAAWSEF